MTTRERSDARPKCDVFSFFRLFLFQSQDVGIPADGGFAQAFDRLQPRPSPLLSPPCEGGVGGVGRRPREIARRRALEERRSRHLIPGCASPPPRPPLRKGGKVARESADDRKPCKSRFSPPNRGTLSQPRAIRRCSAMIMDPDTAWNGKPRRLQLALRSRGSGRILGDVPGQCAIAAGYPAQPPRCRLTLPPPLP